MTTPGKGGYPHPWTRVCPMGAARPQEDARLMLTPIVTEIRRAGEPVGRDTFIADDEREREGPTNVVRLSQRRSHGRRSVPARAA